MGGYTVTVHNQPTRSTEPCIPPGSLNRVPASARGKGWNVTSAGWQVTLCDPIWHVSSSSGVATSVSELLYPCYFTLLYFKFAYRWKPKAPTSITIRDLVRPPTPWCPITVRCDCDKIIRVNNSFNDRSSSYHSFDC